MRFLLTLHAFRARFFYLLTSKISPKLLAILLTAGSAGLCIPEAIAQTGPVNVPVRSEDGSVRVNNNARQIRTGPLRNTSNIPLPSALPVGTSEGVSIPTDRTRQAPNTVEFTPNLPYIEQSFNDLINSNAPNGEQYNLQADSVQISTTFDLIYRQGDHNFGEGIQVSVIGSDGQRSQTQTIFVRGDGVRVGPNGQALPAADEATVVYGGNDVVELRVLNLRSDRAQPTESAIYFTQNFRADEQLGGFIVEDSQDGGDRDFDDGEYVDGPNGLGQGIAVRDRPNLMITTTTERSPLDPLIEQDITEDEVLVERAPETNVEEIETGRIRGRVELPDDNPSNQLGHARGIRTENDEQLVYSRYSGASEVRLGSDGLGVTGQLAPLIKNPSAPPTLLTGNLRFDPTVGDNEAGLTATAGITQFLSRTHRVARDMFGNEIVNPNEDGPRLLEPTGIFSNRRLLGYVPAQQTGTQQGAEIFSVNGVFDLPTNQAVQVAPPNPQMVGRGNSGYTDNVGGLLIERASGEFSFVPQWTKAGFSQSSVALAAGEASRIIYALVPQQSGQNLQLGQTYAVTKGANEYVIADGNFRIISADLQPQNFVQEMAEVYAVEDTLPVANAQTAEFNGIQDVYAQVPGGDRIPTVDVNDAAEADARVGNELFPVSAVIAPGQSGYMRTRRAGGLYLTGGLTGGLGNQRDTVFRNRITTVSIADDLVRQRTVNMFMTPREQVTTLTTEDGTIVRTTGTATFEINQAGELSNANFIAGPDPDEIINVDNQTTSDSQIELGDRTLMDSDTTEAEILQSTTREVSRDEESVTDRDSYPNFSAVLGELALGGVFNFGNTPWTIAANTARAELFYRDTVFGDSATGSETGVRAEVVFHPFGERQRDAYQYDEAGNVIAIYQTEPVLDENGNRAIATLTNDSDETVEVAVNQFVLDESGERIPQRVGTGKPKGPGAYLRLENVFDNSDTEIAGGLQLSF